MDDIGGVIIAALNSGLMDVGKSAVKDAYQAVKTYFVNRFGTQSNVVKAVEGVEQKPDDPARQAVLTKEAAAITAPVDDELKGLMKDLLAALEKLPEGSTPASKISIKADKIGVVAETVTITKQTL